MPRRTVLFVDYQNAYKGARETFHQRWDPSPYGQIDPMSSVAFSWSATLGGTAGRLPRSASTEASPTPARTRRATGPTFGSAPRGSAPA